MVSSESWTASYTNGRIIIYNKTKDTQKTEIQQISVEYIKQSIGELIIQVYFRQRGR